MKIALLTVLLTCPFMQLQSQEAPPAYLDTTQPLEVRVDDLISRMTLEEKAAMMSNATPGVPRLGVPKFSWWNEALHGVANAGTATVFPQAIGLAAMWDEPFQEEIAHVIGIEGRAKFNGYKGTPDEGGWFRGLTFWSPNINIFRDPRWGRGQETYGEDPFLTSRLGVAFVKGLQGDDPHHMLAAACAKHFAVHSGPESLRHIFDVSPSQADLYETYFPAFEALVREADVEGVMMAYNALYGTPCSISPLLYGKLTEWGFDGYITSDCGSVDDLSRTFKAAESPVQANAMTLEAGMDLRCGDESAALREAVEVGFVPESLLDTRLARLLTTLFQLGLFDPEDQVSFNQIPPSMNNAPEHGAMALRSARESMVLLKNNGVLPLDKSQLTTVAVIGPNASSIPALVGNYNGIPAAPVTILDGLKAALESTGVNLVYAYGCDYAARPGDVRHFGNGWFQTTYFANPDLAGEPAVTTTERPPMLDYGNPAVYQNKPPAGVPAEGMSARWSGNLDTTQAGDYTLVVRARGGFRLTIDGQSAIDSWAPPGGQEDAIREERITHHFADNASVPIVLEYTQGAGPALISMRWDTPPADASIGEAVAVAKSADVVIFVGGLTAQLEGEEMQVDYEGFSGGDRLSIELPAVQQQLLEQLHALGKPVIVVNLSGSAVALPWASEHAAAILQAWYPGQAGGTAVADVLFGDYTPAGRLPVTFYRSTEDLPDFKDYTMEGRTYKYFKGEPLYPFGHGLSYTQFKYSGLKIKHGAKGTLTLTVQVKNTGDVDGDEVVQVYATAPKSAQARESQALCGFARVHLKAGESRKVKITIPEAALLHWDDEAGASRVPAGKWQFSVGASSADLRQHTTVKL